MKKINLIEPTESIKKSLIALGLWHFESKWFPVYRLYTILLHGLVTLPFVIFATANIVESTNIRKLTESLFISLTSIAEFVKVVHFIYCGRFLKELLKAFENNIFQPRTDDELNVFKSPFKHFVNFKFFYIFLAETCLLISFTGPFVTSGYKLPLPCKFPFDVTIPKNFWYAYWFEVFSTLMLCYLNITMDMAMSFLLLQVGNYYEIVGMRLTTIGELKSIHGSKKESGRRVIKDLIENIEAYESAKLLAQGTQDFISVPTFVQNSLSTLIICASAYQLNMTSSSVSSPEFIMLIYYMLALFFQVFLPCFYGNMVLSKSSLVMNCVYSCKWYNFPLKCQKLIYFFMENLKTPMTIRVGKLYLIVLETFSKTMNNAYSLYAVLKQTKVKNQI